MTNQWTICLLIILSIVVSACTGLGGEPEIVATLPQPTSVAEVIEEEPRFPQAIPDIENGSEIFAARCVDCHGEDGDGQGKLVQEGSIPPAPDMTDISITSLKTPQEWYDVITDGRIEVLMPPWKNALTPAERWDVAHYLYTLPYSEAMLTQGEQIWTNLCADCESVNALVDLESAVTISDASFGNQIDRDDFDSELSVGEIRAAVAYARSQSVANPSSIGVIAEPVTVADNPEITIGDFIGVVEHGTSGGVVPADTVVQMQYGNPTEGFQFAQTTINYDFTFVFEDIPLTSAFLYNVGAVYRDRLFAKTLADGHDDLTDYNQTVTIYDLTDDVFNVSISQVDMFIDPINVPDVGEGLRVTQRLRFNNASDRMYTTGRAIGDGREAVTLVQIPVGALITSGEANGRYIIVEDIEGTLDSIIDTYPILPGDQHEIILEYFVPYADGAIIDQPFNNILNGEISITISNNLEVISDTLTLQSDENTDPSLNVYRGELVMDSDPTLIFEIAGNPFSTTSEDSTVVTTDTLFPILLGGIIVIVILVVGVIAFTGRSSDNRQQIDTLIKQIAELDAMHDNGQINHDVYQQQRQDLKQQLAQLMQADPPAQEP